MADKQSLPTLFGLFRDQAAAEAAVDRLAGAGFGSDEIGFLAPGQVEEPN